METNEEFTATVQAGDKEGSSLRREQIEKYLESKISRARGLKEKTIYVCIGVSQLRGGMEGESPNPDR